MFRTESKPYMLIEDILKIEDSSYYATLVNNNPTSAVNHLFDAISNKIELASQLQPPSYVAIRKYLENIGVKEIKIDSYLCELLKQKRKYLNIINH